MKKMNAYRRIRKAMITNERSVLKHIRSLNKDGVGYRPFNAGTWWNALDRLEKKGKIFYRKTRTFNTYAMNGYWIRTTERTK